MNNCWDNFETEELTLINKSMSYGIDNSGDRLSKEQITEAIGIVNEIGHAILSRRKNEKQIKRYLQVTVNKEITELLLKEIDQSRPHSSR